MQRIGKLHYHTHNELRHSFLKYFNSKKHEIVKSSSVAPGENDTSLLFTNAGMNQFKSIILNSNESKRVANIQKCIRAGGKHNDLDDVGKDLHHLTFFEMMGNWSFNNAYSKKEACEFAWDYLTNILRISPDRLYVSYFKGSEQLGIEPDNECFNIWKNIGVSKDRILAFGPENFWEMGSTGPCGPCTEIHYDRIGNRDASRLVNVDDSVVEIWNLVFMSNLRDINGKIQPLGRHHIDTGMGFERLLSIIQQKSSNFDTDVFSPIIKKLENVSNIKYHGSVDFSSIIGKRDAAFRVVSDHIRSVSFAISDYAIPDSTGAGFVVRKMLRRMFLQSSYTLNLDRYFLSDLVPIVSNIMAEFYPQIRKDELKIQKMIHDEENQFWKTVDKAKRKFDEISRKTEGDIISGKDAFNLYSTFGLPFSITTELARNLNKTVDEVEFQRFEAISKNESKKASKFLIPISGFDFPTHTDSLKYNYDSNYCLPEIETSILGLYQDNLPVESFSGNGIVILENCQFYGEQGGQIGDQGVLKINEEIIFNVNDTKKSPDGNVTMLIGETVKNGSIQKYAKCIQIVDSKRRRALCMGHSATHLLNWALKSTGLGRSQRGSLVDVNRIRFDYSVGDEIDGDSRLRLLEKCEKTMENLISKKGKTKIGNVSMKEAKRVQPDFKEENCVDMGVRIVTLADEITECCCGTHVKDISDIGKVAIMSDKSCAKGIRRITMKVGGFAESDRNYSIDVIKKLKRAEYLEIPIIYKNIDWNRIPLVERNDIMRLVGKSKMKKIEK